MFKIEVSPYAYYFDTEDVYDEAKRYQQLKGYSHKLLALSTVCIDFLGNVVVKNRSASMREVYENSITLEEPRKEITIVVHGSVGSGKTRIAALISKFLSSQDFKISMEFKEERPCDVFDNLDEVIDIIKKKVKINIQEKQLSRSGYML